MQQRTLSSAGRRALEILEAAPWCNGVAFSASYWSEREALDRLPKAVRILNMLIDEGLVGKTIAMGREGPLYYLQDSGRALIQRREA